MRWNKNPESSVSQAVEKHVNGECDPRILDIENFCDELLIRGRISRPEFGRPRLLAIAEAQPQEVAAPTAIRLELCHRSILPGPCDSEHESSIGNNKFSADPQV